MKNNLGMHYRKRNDVIEVTTPRKKEKLYFDGIAAAHTQYGIKIQPEYGPTFTVSEWGNKRYF